MGSLGADIPCRKCGYNLRGLNVEGKCPECGTMVGLSVSGDLLRFSDPEWVQGLGSGVRLILWGVVVMIVAMAAGVVLTLMREKLLGSLMTLGAQGLSLAGWWILTRPDPSGIGEDRYGKARQIIRIGLIGGMVGSGCYIVAQDSIGYEQDTALIIHFVGQILALVGLVAQLQYLKKLAVRIPDDGLKERAGFLQHALGWTYGVSMAGGMAMMVLAKMKKPQSSMMVGFGCGAAIVGMVMLVFWIMFLVMIGKFGKRFKEQAEYGRQAWAGQGLKV